MIKALLPVFQHDFQQAVWHMAVDPGEGLIALELRDQQQAEACFSLLDLHTRSLLFDRYALEEDWWVGLAALQQGRMLIKQYHDTQQPEKQGLIAINIKSLEVDWWKEDFQLDELMENAVKGASTIDEKKVSTAVDIETGKELDPEKLNSRIPDGSVFHPTHYPETSSHFATIKRFLAENINSVPMGACDYLEFKGLIMLSYFISEGAALSNHLIIFNEAGEAILQQKLGSGLNALASGTFFVINNYLVFITNKTQLCVYELQFDF